MSKPPTRRDGPVGRFYEIDGAQYPSVTHVLQVIAKPALINWAANQERAAAFAAAAELYAQIAESGATLPRAVYLSTLDAAMGKEKAHRRELEKAGDIGTQIHALIEWRLRQQLRLPVGPEPKAADAAQWGAMAFEDWAKAVDLKPKFIESVVYSKTHRYAGTMDLLADVEGVETLVDFKSGKAVYAEAHLQAAAYRHALAEMELAPPGPALIVRLPKVESDPAFEVVPCPSAETLMPTFVAALNLWAWWHAEEKAYYERRKGAKAVA